MSSNDDVINVLNVWARKESRYVWGKYYVTIIREICTIISNEIVACITIKQQTSLLLVSLCGVQFHRGESNLYFRLGTCEF